MSRRAVIPKPIKGGGTSGFRGVDDIPTSNTVPGGSPKTGTGEAGLGEGGSETPRLGGDKPDAYKPPVINEGDAIYSPNTQGTGTASTSTNLCTRNKSSCDDMKDVAEELVEQIMDAISDAAEPDASSAGQLPTATAAIIGTAARNASTVAPTPTPMPNLNMSSWMDLYDYRTLFTEEELDMLQDDPLCFYANYARLYEDYASSSRTSTGSEPETSTTTTAPAKRTVQPLPRGDDSEARTLYLSYLPDQIKLIYTSTPTSLTVTATATTTCSGLSGLGISDFETPYAVFGYRDGHAPSETAAADSTTEVTSGGASRREELMPLTGLAMLGLLWLSRLI